jgi:hypothetical protein
VRASELEKFNGWVRRNYKFMNYARRSLVGGEAVIHAVLQPEIRANEVTIFGKTFYRVVSPTFAFILTDRELIVIREAERKGWEARYGGIWDFIPLDKIRSLTLSEKDSSLLALSIQLLPEGTRLELLVRSSAKQELEPILDRLGRPVA